MPTDPLSVSPCVSLKERASQLHWWHSIDLGEGVVTSGGKSRELLRIEADVAFGPLDLAGSQVLDIGAWDGFFSFEAKRRGAVRVLATDQYVWFSSRFSGRRPFELARERSGLDIEDQVIDVPEISDVTVGKFDYVLFLGVFYHLIDPYSCVQKIATTVGKAIVIETHLDLNELTVPAMRFYRGSELNNDPTNWWGPNRICVESILNDAGFRKIDFTPHPSFPETRGFFHAYR
jgi:tRNA (mo5U34)-methyltransferase